MALLRLLLLLVLVLVLLLVRVERTTEALGLVVHLKVLLEGAFALGLLLVAGGLSEFGHREERRNRGDHGGATVVVAVALVSVVVL